MDLSYQKAASTIIAAGQIPIPVTETLIELLQTVMTEEQAEFVTLMPGPMNRDELLNTSGFDEPALDRMLDGLMNEGIITGIPGKTSGTVVYRVLPPIPGLFEYTMMRGESGEKQKTLARLFEKLFDELAVMVQANYDAIVPAFSVLPAMTRVIPVETAVDAGHDAILPSEDVLALIDRFDPIAVVHCYCRHQKDLLEKPCRVTDERKNCLMFGRTAQFAVDRKFGEPVTKDQARAILAKAKQSGLVHKAFHEKSDPFKDEMAICNCCKCCCETFQVFYRGAGPSLTTTAHIARLDLSLCTGCESCTAMCPMEALTMQGDRAVLEESRCIGCGVCVHHCPAEALSLVRTGLRTACVIPARKP